MRVGSKHCWASARQRVSQQLGPSHVSSCARDLSRDETVNSQRTKRHLLNASPGLVRRSRETYTTWQYITSQRPEPGWGPLGGVGEPGSGWPLAFLGPGAGPFHPGL